MTEPAARYGHIKISRKAYAEDRWWLEPRVFSKWEAWEDCIQMATWKPRKFAVGFQVEQLERGEFMASLRFLAERWRWDKMTVKRWFEAAQKALRLQRQREGQGGTVYLLVNYERYQGNNADIETVDETPSETGARQERDKTEAVKQLKTTSSSKTTWLTPFGAAWEARCGGTPNYRQFAKILKPVVDALGAEPALARWQRYLDDTEPRFCSVNRFAAIHGTYATPAVVEFTDDFGRMRPHRRRDDGRWDVQLESGEWTLAEYADGVEVET